LLAYDSIKLAVASHCCDNAAHRYVNQAQDARFLLDMLACTRVQANMSSRSIL